MQKCRSLSQCYGILPSVPNRFWASKISNGGWSMLRIFEGKVCAAHTGTDVAILEGPLVPHRCKLLEWCAWNVMPLKFKSHVHWLFNQWEGEDSNSLDANLMRLVLYLRAPPLPSWSRAWTFLQPKKKKKGNQNTSHKLKTSIKDAQLLGFRARILSLVGS